MGAATCRPQGKESEKIPWLPKKCRLALGSLISRAWGHLKRTMPIRVFRIIPLLAAFGVACSDATADSDGLPAGGSSSSIAGSGPQTMIGGAAGASGAGGSVGGGGASVAGAPLVGGVNQGGWSGGGSAGALAGGGGAQGGGGVAALDGKGLYDANCKECHAEQGAGGLLAPEIMHPVRDYSTWVIRNGRAQTSFPKPMEKWGTDKLSDAQLSLIFDYLDLPPQPTTGKALYDDYCASCHGADAKGGPTMRSLINEVDKVLTQVRSGKNVGKFAMRRDYMPAFPVGDISDAELKLIRDYVDSL